MFRYRAALAPALLALGLTLQAPGWASADESGAAPSGAESSAPAASAAGISEEERDRRAEAIARSIMSPFCPGRTVSACPNAGPWRDDIRRWVGEGVDSNEIKRRLAERVPEHNLGGAPKNRLGWILPVGLALAAVGLLVFLLRYLVGPRTGAARGQAPGAAAGGSEQGGKTRTEPSTAESAPASTAPAAAGDATAQGSGTPGGNVDWDARLERELERLES